MKNCHAHKYLFFSISNPKAFSKNSSVKFKFSFNSCHEPFPYETAKVVVYSLKSDVSSIKDTSNFGSKNENVTDGSDEEMHASKSMSNESALIKECGKSIDGKELSPVHVETSVKILRTKDGRSEISLVVSWMKYVDVQDDNQIL